MIKRCGSEDSSPKKTLVLAAQYLAGASQAYTLASSDTKLVIFLVDILPAMITIAS